MRKAEHLVDFYLGAAESTTSKPFASACYEMAGRTRRLVRDLLIAKGVAIHLETDRDGDGALVVVPKNPKSVGRLSQRAAPSHGKGIGKPSN